MSAILSEPSEASSMAFPDYGQTSADHRRGLLMIVPVGSKAQYIYIRTVSSLLLSKFIYSEKATKFCEISTLLLSTVHTDKSKVEISQNFVAFSEYMKFMYWYIRFFHGQNLSVLCMLLCSNGP